MRKKHNRQPEPEDKENFVPMGTKISPDMAMVWDAICNALHTDTYHLLQGFIMAMIRAASPQHALTPDIRKLMIYLESDVSWQEAINRASPNGKLRVSQLVMIVEQDGKKGFDMVMLEKPFFYECKQTECVDDIIERILDIGTKGIFKRLKVLEKVLGSESMVETLIILVDRLLESELKAQDEEEMRGPANYHDFGRAIEYGKRTKRKPHYDPDNLPQQQTIHFTDDDREAADREAGQSASEDAHEWLENNTDFKPHGGEW